ncbi:MAG: peptidase S41 [Bacteroidales bacterium]|nr:peptidase S41 [Bacteroidales bacterium]
MKFRILSISLCVLALLGCEKKQLAPVDNTQEQEQEQEQQQQQEQAELQKTYKYVNTFAYNMMNLYYLWKKEIASGLEKWKQTDEPVAKVLELRYKDAAGNDIDRWTTVIDDFESFYGSVTGESSGTYGFDLTLMYYDESHKQIVAVVTYTYADSPAREAGLKRGDVIMEVNGKTMTPSNYVDLVNKAIFDSKSLKLTLMDGKSVSMQAREMYEDPVLLSKVFDCGGGRKAGYLVYTSFTMESYKALTEACRAFRAEGISDLILDLRYNGGGFARAEQILASLIGPEDEVLAGSVLATEVFNEDLTEYYKSKEIDTKTYFATEYDFSVNDKNYKFSTKGANAKAGKLYVIISSGTASASEALVCDLSPYMDVTLIGSQSHGKYCSGLPLEAVEFYEDYAEELGKTEAAAGKKYAENWGLYVMYSRFADKNGETLCMPDGLKPDVEADDKPSEPYQLGDPSEAMLAKALALCGYTFPTARPSSAAAPARAYERLDIAPLRPGFGLYIHPMDDGTAAFHAAKPGHLPLGKLVDGGSE